MNVKYICALVRYRGVILQWVKIIIPKVREKRKHFQKWKNIKCLINVTALNHCRYVPVWKQAEKFWMPLCTCTYMYQLIHAYMVFIVTHKYTYLIFLSFSLFQRQKAVSPHIQMMIWYMWPWCPIKFVLKLSWQSLDNSVIGRSNQANCNWGHTSLSEWRNASIYL